MSHCDIAHTASFSAHTAICTVASAYCPLCSSGNTLWTLNFFLYAATVQVSSVEFHMTDNSYGSPWEPDSSDGTPPHVRSSYYAFAAIDQLIGAKCNTRVASLNPSQPNGYDNTITAYSVYRGDDLSAVVFINGQPSYGPSASAPTVSFQLSLPQFAGKTLYQSVLSAATIDATTNTTWNGLSFEQSGTGAPTSVQDGGSGRTYRVGSDGSVTVSVRDSQAIMLQLDSQVGSDNRVDEKACRQLAGTLPDANPSGSGATGTFSGNGAAPTFRSTTGFASEDGLGTGGIIGITVGAAAGILLIGFLVFLCVCLRNRRRSRIQGYVARAGGASALTKQSNKGRGHGWALPVGSRQMRERDEEARTPFRPESGQSAQTYFYDARRDTGSGSLSSPEMPSVHEMTPNSSRTWNHFDSPRPKASFDRSPLSHAANV